MALDDFRLYKSAYLHNNFISVLTDQYPLLFFLISNLSIVSIYWHPDWLLRGSFWQCTTANLTAWLNNKVTTLYRCIFGSTFLLLFKIQCLTSSKTFRKLYPGKIQLNTGSSTGLFSVASSLMLMPWTFPFSSNKYSPAPSFFQLDQQYKNKLNSLLYTILCSLSILKGFCLAPYTLLKLNWSRQLRCTTSCSHLRPDENKVF